MSKHKLTANASPSFWAVLLSYWVLGTFFSYISQYIFLEEAIKRAFASLSAPLISTLIYTPASQVHAPVRAPADPLPDEGAPRAPISVALLTDDDLADYRVTYPVSYEFHAERLDTIAAQNPHAIFIDLLFIDDRADPTLDVLTDTLCTIAKTRGIPIFVASIGDPERPLRKEFEKIAEKGCIRKVAVPRKTDHLDRNNWEYLLGVGGGPTALPSPALAIAATLRGEDPVKTLAATKGTPLGLVWGMPPHSYNTLRMRATDGSPLCRSEWRWLREIPGVSTVLDAAFEDEYAQLRNKPFCPYHASFPLGYLSDTAKQPVTQRLIENRVVMYGADLQSASDSTYSPLHGEITGIFVHAMALDNLLTLGANYPRAEEFSLEHPVSSGTLFPASVVFIASLIAAIVNHLKHRGSPSVRALFEPPTSCVMTPDTLDPAHHRLHRRILETVTQADPSLKTRLIRMLLLALTDLATALRSMIFLIGLLPVYLLLLWIVGLIGLYIFELGPLSWIEYAVLPMLLEVFHLGLPAALYVDSLWRAGFSPGWPANGRSSPLSDSPHLHEEQ